MLVTIVVVTCVTEPTVTHPCIREWCGGKGNLFALSDFRRCSDTVVKIEDDAN